MYIHMMMLRNTLLLLPLLWFLNMPSEAVKRRIRALDVGMMDGIERKLTMKVWSVLIVDIYSCDYCKSFRTSDPLTVLNLRRSQVVGIMPPFYSIQHTFFFRSVC